MRLMSPFALAFVLAGCAATTSLPYTPEQQPSGARVSAAYQMVGDELRIEIETSGRRLEEALLLKADGALRPQHVRVTPRAMSGGPISIGVGAGTFGGGVGTGVSVSAPVGGTTAPATDGNTIVSFGSAQAGPPPWRLQVKLTGVEPVLIVVGTAPGGSR